MATQTNLWLNMITQSFNTGAIKNGFKPGQPVALVFAPSSFTFTTANMLTQAAFITAQNALMQNATRSSRGFPLMGLDKFTPSEKKTASFDTGLYQEMVIEFPAKWDFIVKLAQNNLSNFLEMYKMNNLTGYGFFIVDTNGAWWGTTATDGVSMAPFTLQQFYVPKWNPTEPDKTAVYGFSLSFASVSEFTTNFAYFNCPSLNSTALTGLVNVVLQQPPSAAITAMISAQAGSSTTCVAVMAKYGCGSGDFFADYGSVLTKACFAATNLTTGATLTISTMVWAQIVVSSVPYNYGFAVLSAAPTSGHVVQIAMTSPVTVYGIIAAYMVTEVLVVGTDGQNATVKTFA